MYTAADVGLDVCSLHHGLHVLCVVSILPVLEAVRAPIICCIDSQFQILMNVQRTVMAASRCAQTLMDHLSVPVEMGSVLAVKEGAVMVSELLERCKKAD